MKNRTLLAIACFALAALLVFAGIPFITGIASEKITVVQVNKNITAGSMVTEADVTTVEIGKFGVKADTIRQPEDVIGKYTTTNLYPGTNLLPQMLTANPWNANAALEVLDGNKMAVSITVPSLAAMLSGKLERGDVVSVVATDNEAAYQAHLETEAFRLRADGCPGQAPCASLRAGACRNQPGTAAGGGAGTQRTAAGTGPCALRQRIERPGMGALPGGIS